MKPSIRFIFSKIIFLLVIFPGFSQKTASFVYNGGTNYTMIERTDLRRYDNNKYIGLKSREVRSCVAWKDGFYDGSFYVDEDIKHQNIKVESSIHNAIPSSFKITEDGQLIMIEDCGYPSFRSFPAFPKTPVSLGESWTATAERSVDPLNKGIPTKFKMEVLYTYIGDEFFHEEEVYVLSADWATRYGPSNIDENGDSDLLSASGKHKATIYISKQTGYALVVRDYCEETFFYSDKKQYTFKGGISLFTEYVPTIDSTDIIPVINKIVQNNTDDSIRFEKTSAGLTMTMRNLRFKPDSAELMPEENNLLDQIAQILLKSEGNIFLIEGHTASTGNPDGEMKLSVERANSIALELVKRGVPSAKIICQGRGSSRPIANNNTAEGKAENRRVEITIFSR